MSDTTPPEERPYLAINGHRMYQYPQYTRDGRVFYSSAFTNCTDDCPACAAGEPLLDW